MRKLGVALAVLSVACLLAGCGGEGGGGGSTPKAAFEAMWGAAKAGNQKAMMACFSEVCRSKMAEVEKMFADMPKELKEGKESMAGELMAKAKSAKVEIGAEKIDGDKATLEVTTDGRKDTLEFIKEGGSWKMHISELANLDLDQMKKAMEMLKNMPKGVMEGLQKGMKDALK